MKRKCRLATLGAAMIAAPSAFAAPTLSLNSNLGVGPLHSGDLFEITLDMSDLDDNEVAGFVAFVEYDPLEATFIGGEYTDSPFGLHHIDPIVATGGVIAISAGIDTDDGQTPTSDDAVLATLTFQALFDGYHEFGDCILSIGFAEHDPPTMLTDIDGHEITPLVLSDLPELPASRLLLGVDFGEVPVEAGDFVVVTLSMQICDGTEATGFQAFLHFDSTELAFVSGAYVDDSFGQPLIWPIVADGEQIAVSAGIDMESGQPPATGYEPLALITFMSVSGGCVAPVTFAGHDPPTRISDPFGEEIIPLGLDGLPEVICPADIVRDCIVDVLDLLAVLTAWDDTIGDADINQDGIVDVLDLLYVLAAWGPCL